MTPQLVQANNCHNQEKYDIAALSWCNFCCSLEIAKLIRRDAQRFQSQQNIVRLLLPLSLLDIEDD